jgi:predicted acetyltransferase
MRQIRKLSAESDFDGFVAIAANAYPGIKVVSEDDRQKLKQRLMARAAEDPTIALYGAFDGEQIVGGMRLHDFVMNMRSAQIPAGGVGFVAVDLLHKKQGVAKDMISFFVSSCRERGQPLALLYPFRPDFYKQMGFGYGTKISQYRVKPAHLPKGPTREHVRLLTADDKQLLADCYHRYQAATHGLIAKTSHEVDGLFGNPENRIVGCVRDGAVAGYLVSSFKPAQPDTFLVNDLLIKELVYEDRAVLAELLTFLHTQADQIRQVIIDTQDDALHHIFFDPRDGSDNFIAGLYQESNLQGVGIMYRAVDLRALFGALGAVDFGGQSCALKITLRDSFFGPNEGDVVVRFDSGRPSVRDGGDHEVAIALDVAEFSSLVMGVVSFKKLYSYGLAQISDPRYLDTMTRLFAVEDKPLCLTWF